MHRHKSANILNGPFKISYQERLSNILKSKLFSISADEVKDISGKNYLAICVHFYLEESSQSIAKLWKLIDLVIDCSAEKIYNILDEEILNKFKNNIIGFVTDGAPTFQGKFGGVKAFIKKKIPGVITIHCLAHATDIIAKRAFNTLDYEIASFITELTVFFTKSSTNKAKLVQIQKDFNIKPSNLLSICKTRWLETFNSIKRINEKWDIILEYFKG